MLDFSVDAVIARRQQAAKATAIEKSRVARQISMLLDVIDDETYADRPDRPSMIREAHDLAVSSGHLHFIDVLERKFPYLKGQS